MTKRDLTTWFVKIVGWVGVLSSALELLSWMSNFAMSNFAMSSFGGNPLQPLLSLAVWGFVLLFCGGLGSALAGEGEYGPLLQSKGELAALSRRCIGFWLLVSGAHAFNLSLISLAGYYSLTPFFNFAQLRPIVFPGLASGFLEALLGLLLLFLPISRVKTGAPD